MKHTVKSTKTMAGTSQVDTGVDDILQKIDFSPEDVVQAAAENTRLFRQAVDYRMEQVKRRNVAKMQQEEAEAEAELLLRADARDTGEKITENHIKAHLLVDPKLHDLREVRNHADEREEYSKLLIEMVKMRRDCLQIIQGLAMTEGSLRRAAESANAELAKIRSKAQARYPGAAGE